MKNKPSWMLPADVLEMLPDQAERVEFVRRRVINLMLTWGYRYVMPPLIEFLDSLLSGTGRDLDLQTFKLTDQQSGRMLGVRADITPQVARIDAHRLPSEYVSRYCYAGSVLRTYSDGVTPGRNPILVGAELFGEPSIGSDVEVIMLMLAMADELGFCDTVLDVGHVGIFNALCEFYGICDEKQQELHQLCTQKAEADILQWCQRENQSTELEKDLLFILHHGGDIEVIDEAKAYFCQHGEKILQVLQDLTDGISLIKKLTSQQNINIDLAEVRGYTFHNGMVFALYVPGYYDAVARGGRYDGAGRAFGRNRPATGFSADLLTLAKLALIPQAGSKTVIEMDMPCCNEEMLRLNELRKQGYIVYLRHGVDNIVHQESMHPSLQMDE